MIRTRFFPAFFIGLLFSAGCSPTEPVAAPPDVPVERTTPEPQYFLGKDQTHNRFSRTIPPVLTVPSGAVIEARTKEASDEQISPDSTLEDLEKMDRSLVHPLTGPVYVEGAEPGDTLAVTIHEMELEGWGWTSVSPGSGFLPEVATRRLLKIFQIDKTTGTTAFSDRISIPVRPFPGVMGVAPDTEELLRTRPPRANGGNMDNKYLVEGTVVYFPVLVKGALFSVGDTHAAQGDGEVSGVAIEAPLRIVYQVEVIKGGRKIQEPQYETDDFYGVTGFAPTLDEAARKATRYMVEYLVEEHGMDPVEAYSLCSLVADLKISEVVDLPNMLVSMHLPKNIFLD